MLWVPCSRRARGERDRKPALGVVHRHFLREGHLTWSMAPTHSMAGALYALKSTALPNRRGAKRNPKKADPAAAQLPASTCWFPSAKLAKLPPYNIITMQERCRALVLLRELNATFGDSCV